MKKVISIVCLLALTACCLFAFASCAKKISGAYESEINILGQKYNVTYTFSDKNVSVERKATVLGTVNTSSYEGTYEIAENDDGTMEITFSFENGDETVKSGTFTFEEGEDYIKIGGAQYNKVEK